MPRERLSMRKIKEVLRLSAAGLSRRQVARATGVSLGAVDATAAQATAAEYGVDGYPTIKWFHRGEAERYEGGRTADDVIGFALSTLETLGVEAEVAQLVSQRQFDLACNKAAVSPS